MRCLAAFCALAWAGTAFAAGPLSSFQKRAPNQDYISSAKQFDAERCLLNLDGEEIPMVYRQPDRPGHSMLIYSENESGRSAMRIDLTETPAGLRVEAWSKLKQIKLCAPEKR